MASQAHGEPITGSSLTASPFSTKKKKIQSQKLNPINPSRRWRLASRRVIAGKEIKPQYKSKPNIELSKPNTEHRGVYQKKKKKILNTQTKTKPSNPRTVTLLSSSPQRARRRCRRDGRHSSQIDIDIIDGISIIGIRLIAQLSAPLPLRR